MAGNLRHDKGVAAVLAAASLMMMVGFAALAVDLGLGFNERRADQTAADVGVMAGAVDTLGSNTQIRDHIMDFAARNVPAGAISQADWETCTDPERASLNSTGFKFIPVAAPSGWSGTKVDCISIDPAGYVRVNLPPQSVETTFGRALGVNELSTGADAVARIRSRGGGGILPFGILATAGSGQHVCLRDNSAGQAEPPCDGSDQGNFGGLESLLYGNEGLGTSPNCNGSPKKDVLAINIALGLDHRVVPDSDGVTSNEIRDTCSQIDAGNTPDTLNTFQGISQGLEEGLATGPVPGGFEPRLQQGSNSKRSVYGSMLDDRPLWDYLLASPAGSIPPSCVQSSFDTSSNPDQDWDGDGADDPAASWQHMSKCLQDFVAGGHTTIMFSETLQTSPRFAYVPQFWEASWPPGNGWRHIRRYKATWLQGTWWKKGGSTTPFHPGEPGTFTGSNPQLRQLSGILLPDDALPSDLRGDPPPLGGVDPYSAELYR